MKATKEGSSMLPAWYHPHCKVHSLTELRAGVVCFWVEIHLELMRLPQGSIRPVPEPSIFKPPHPSKALRVSGQSCDLCVTPDLSSMVGYFSHKVLRADGWLK